MTVAENIAFPLEMRKVPTDRALSGGSRRRSSWSTCRAWATACRAQLSGGQQQRVALARADRVRSPSLLLLDEPFGALDRKLREQMQLEVRRLQQQLGLTAVFVTHDQEEALILSDRIAVMEEGRIVAARHAAGDLPPSRQSLRRRIHRRIEPAAAPRLTGRAVRSIEGGATVAVPRCARRRQAGEIGLLLRPERPRRLTAARRRRTTFAGAVAEVVYLGETVKYRIRARCRLRDARALALPRGRGSRCRSATALQVGWDRDDAALGRVVVTAARLPRMVARCAAIVARMAHASAVARLRFAGAAVPARPVRLAGVAADVRRASKAARSPPTRKALTDGLYVQVLVDTG